MARASLEKLLADYEDVLRTRNARMWEKDSEEAQYVRRLGGKAGVTYEVFREFTEKRPAEIVADIALCLIHPANYLLDQQVRRLEQDFLKEGGLRERMTRARSETCKRGWRLKAEKEQDLCSVSGRRGARRPATMSRGSD